MSPWTKDLIRKSSLSGSFASGRDKMLPQMALLPSLRKYVFSDIISSIYPNINGPLPSAKYFSERIILTARNIDVDDVNKHVLACMPGNSRTYSSVDSVVSETGVDDKELIDPDHLTPEYLCTLNTSGLPPGELVVKLGCPLILLQNIFPSQGLCNGTHLLLRRMMDRVLEVEILSGDHHGELTFIPCITFTPSGKQSEHTFQLWRCQFPIRLAFAISINKAQGQSVDIVGSDLRMPVFTHELMLCFQGVPQATMSKFYCLKMMDHHELLT